MKRDSIDLTDENRRSCATCTLRDLCMPAALPVAELKKLDTLVSVHRRIRRGDALFRSGDRFKSLYAVRTGFFKSCMHDGKDRSQVAGFQIPGDVLGLDGISTNLHNLDAIALEDCEVCVIPYQMIERLSLHHPNLQKQLNRVMSCEIVKDHGVMMLLGNMRARERVVAFLLNLSERYKRLGYSPAEFNLRMTREEIGSYLGLKVETVSRTMSNLQKDRMIKVHNKEINLLDLPRLNAVLDQKKQ